jgi:hypothetical protein
MSFTDGFDLVFLLRWYSVGRSSWSALMIGEGGLHRGQCPALEFVEITAAEMILGFNLYRCVPL